MSITCVGLSHVGHHIFRPCLLIAIVAQPLSSAVFDLEITAGKASEAGAASAPAGLCQVHFSILSASSKMDSRDVSVGL